jgi:hypothetical protein
MQIWYELGRAGDAGLTLDELVEKVGARVPTGYARRKLWARESVRARSESRTGVAAPSTPEFDQRAVRYVIRESLGSMTNPRSQTAVRRDTGRYVVGARKPRALFSDEQYDFDGSVTRRAVSDMELMRVLSPLRDQLNVLPGGRLPAMSRQLAAALARWLDAHHVPEDG